MSAQNTIRRVLLVHNEPDRLALFARHLRSAGYVVDIARDGQSAIETIAENPPDIAVFEVAMNGLNGYQACRKLQSHDSDRRVKTILMGESVEAADQYWASQVGASSLLKKPVDFRILLERIRQALLEEESPEVP